MYDTRKINLVYTKRMKKYGIDCQKMKLLVAYYSVLNNVL